MYSELSPYLCRTLDGLIFDARCNRAGFPPEVVLELGELRLHYDLRLEIDGVLAVVEPDLAGREQMHAWLSKRAAAQAPASAASTAFTSKPLSPITVRRPSRASPSVQARSK